MKLGQMTLSMANVVGGCQKLIDNGLIQNDKELIWFL